MPRLLNKRIKLLVPFSLVFLCVLYQFHHTMLKPIDQRILEYQAFVTQQNSGFNPKLSTFSLFKLINSGNADQIYFHWDDYVDTSPGNEILAKFRQDDSECVCDSSAVAYAEVNSYWMESYHTKVLRSMSNLFCVKDVPKKIFVKLPTSFIEVPVAGKKRSGSLLNQTGYSNLQLMNEYQNLDKHSVGLNTYPLKLLNKSMNIDINDFYFDPQYEMFKLNQLDATDSLLSEEHQYLEFLKYANSIVDDSDRYFKYPWIYSDAIQGNSHHLAAPFFKRYIAIRERQSIIQHMIRTWFEFAEAIDVPSWINYGSLLGWAYNGVNMPWDTDVDIQLSIKHLDYLLRHYNNSLILEDPKTGNAKYLLDISPTYIRQGNGRNFIDGRFIDINSGLYIDISALSHTNFEPPKNLVNDKDILVHCKHFNWHSLSEILPIRHTYFEGSSVYIPSNISSILARKYGKESFTTKLNFLNYNYQKDINLWVSDSICPESPAINRFAIDSTGEVDKTQLTYEGACGLSILRDEYRINYQFGERHRMLNSDIDNPVGYSIEDLGDLDITRKDPWEYYNDIDAGLVDNENWFHEYHD